MGTGVARITASRKTSIAPLTIQKVLKLKQCCGSPMLIQLYSKGRQLRMAARVQESQKSQTITMRTRNCRRKATLMENTRRYKSKQDVLIEDMIKK